MKFLLVLLLAASLLNGATIKGAVYDADTLDAVEKAIVSINTVPEQLMVSQGGEYSFEVPSGDYSIRAVKQENGRIALEDTVNVTIRDNGTYNLDLLLFPQTEFFGAEENQGLEEVDYQPQAAQTIAASGQIDWLQTGVAIILLLGFAYLIWRKYGGKPKAVQESAKNSNAFSKKASVKLLILAPEQKQAIGILKKAGGFCSQKELRKAMPFSEAKVSLIVTELEEMQLVKKFKRGRGNIIKLLK